MASLHLVSHTHWDREWYQSFQQFRLRLVRLVDHLLDILAADPEYRHFMLDGQTIVLEDYLQMRPEREDDLRRYIQDGRILIGPWYILPDEFLVSPEATIRNLLEGERVARRFGPKMRVGYLPDTFGHIGQMPQILRGAGIDSAAVWRGMDDQPCEFWWQAPDGSRVLTAYIRGGYGNASTLVNKNFELSARITQGLVEALRPYAASPHLLLMNGSDHQEPSPLTSSAVAFTRGRLGEDMLVHSTLPAYLAGVRSALGEQASALPVVEGELRSSKRSQLLPGVLSTRMWIKQRNRACETLLERWAEPFSTWAEQVAPGAGGRLRCPAEILHQAWRLLMQCHPHDSICGCSIDAVHEEMPSRFAQVETIGEEITRQGLEALAGAVNTLPAPGGALAALVVFNPSVATRTDLLEVKMEDLAGEAGFEITTVDGEALPCEVLDRRSETETDIRLSAKEFREALGYLIGAEGEMGGMKIQSAAVERAGSLAELRLLASRQLAPNSGAWEAAMRQVQELARDAAVETYHVVIEAAPVVTLRLVAPRTPGLGYQTLWVRQKNGAARGPAAPEAEPGNAIENAYFRVEARPDGALDILDKDTGVWYRGQNRLVDGGDRGDEYNYSPPTQDEMIQAVLESAQVESGAAQRSLRLKLRLDLPEGLAEDRQARSARRVSMPLEARVSLADGVRRVDIHWEVDNLARDHRLRVHFAAPFAAAAADYDGHFEIVRRPLDLPAYDADWVEQPRPEKPQRAFTAVSDGRYGLLVANRGLPEAEALRGAGGGAEIAVTLLRCVGWLSRPDLPERPGNAGPGLETPGAQVPGKWSFDLAVLPFRESERMEAYQRAYAFETPLRAVSVQPRGGNLPPGASLVEIAPAEFALSAVKTTEDGRGWLLRGANLSDSEVLVKIRPLLPYRQAWIASLAEEALEALAPAADGSLAISLAAHRLLSVMFR